MGYLYQFHVHTSFSPDSEVNLDKLYKTLIKNKITGIAITDHNTTKGAIEFKKKYGDKINVIVGEEIMTNKGEIIGLFLKNDIPKELNPEDTIKKIKEQDGIVYIPHPFDEKRKKTCLVKEEIQKNKDNIDIIEVRNGRCIENKFNEDALNLCKLLKKSSLCGSDSHSYYEIKYNLVSFETKDINRNNILEEIDKVCFINEKLNKNIHTYTRYIKLKKLIKAGKYNEAFKIIYRRCKRKLFRVM